MRALLIALALSTLTLAGCDRSPPPDASTSVPADSAAQPGGANAAASTVARWQCGDLAVSTHFDDASLESITLQLPDRTLTLKSMADEDGARFADAVGNEFWSRPGNVTLALAGQPQAACSKQRG